MSNIHRLSANLSESTVLGALMYHLDWMDDPKVALQKNDFYLLNHQVLYSIMRERWIDNNFEISAEQLFLEAEKHPTRGKHTITMEMCLNIKTIVGEFTLDTFVRETEILNKLKVLRELDKNGFDVLPIIGEDSINAPNIVEVIKDYTIEEIINTYRTELDTISELNDVALSKTSIEASDGLRAVIESFQTTPQVGALLDGHLFNSVVRGALFGKYYTNSAPTGVGKTRIMLGNAAYLAMPRVLEGGAISHKVDGYQKVLFVPTETSPEETQLMLVASVSGVGEEDIKTNKLTFEELNRVETSLKIIERYSNNFFIEQIADPSVAVVKAKLETHIRRNRIEFIFYDYIFGSPALSSEFPRVREDVALMYLSNTLKELATTYNVFVMSATQLNASWMTSDVRNESMIRGSRSIIDKTDVSMITLDLNNEEFMNIETIVQSLSCRRPNVVTDIFKNRGGRITKSKLFRYFDKDTCRMEDLFLTTENYEVIEVSTVYKNEIKIYNNLIDIPMEGDEENELN